MTTPNQEGKPYDIDCNVHRLETNKNPTMRLVVLISACAYIKKYTCYVTDFDHSKMFIGGLNWETTEGTFTHQRPLLLRLTLSSRNVTNPNI